MTTGRINQVTTFPITDRTAMSTKLLGRPKSHLSFGGSSSPSFKQTLWPGNPLSPHSATDLFLRPQGQIALFPDLTFIRTHCFFVCYNNKKSWPSERTTCDR